MVRRLVNKVGGLEAALGEAASARRALHNTLIELRGNIRVFCRVRPAAPGSLPAVSPMTDGVGVRLAQAPTTTGGRPQAHAFEFDKVYGASATQAAVFADVAELVQSALDGCDVEGRGPARWVVRVDSSFPPFTPPSHPAPHIPILPHFSYAVCLFSYGQTGAGKTHTMVGGDGADDAGVIPRSIAKLLDCARRSAPAGWEYEFEASFVEAREEKGRVGMGGGGEGGSEATCQVSAACAP